MGYLIEELGLKDGLNILISATGVVITFIGITITALFSLLLYKATKQTNELAKANLELAKAITDKNNLAESNITYQYRYEMMQKLIDFQILYQQHSKSGFDIDSMINTISDFEQKNKINIGEIELSKEELGKYFSVEESYELKNIWNHYKKYRVFLPIPPKRWIKESFEKQIPVK